MKLTCYADRGWVLNTPALRSGYSFAGARRGISRMLLVGRWNDCEPTMGAYQFDRVFGTYLDLIPDSLELTLCLLPGNFAPGWLIDQMGAKFLPLVTADRRGGAPLWTRYVLPTDPVYFARLLAAHAALAEYVDSRGMLGRVSEVRVTPSCSDDDEACCTAVEVGGTRVDQAWADAGWRPDTFTSFWGAYTAQLSAIWPGAILALPFLNPDTDFPRVDADGAVRGGVSSIGLVDGLVAASLAAAPGSIAVMQNTMSTAPPLSDWQRWVAMGALPHGQMNDWDGTGGCRPEKGVAPSPEGFEAVMKACEAAGVTALEVHQVDAENPAYADIIAAYGS